MWTECLKSKACRILASSRILKSPPTPSEFQPFKYQQGHTRAPKFLHRPSWAVDLPGDRPNIITVRPSVFHFIMTTSTSWHIT